MPMSDKEKRASLFISIIYNNKVIDVFNRVEKYKTKTPTFNEIWDQ
jgi:hypothetical protein